MKKEEFVGEERPLYLGATPAKSLKRHNRNPPTRRAPCVANSILPHKLAKTNLATHPDSPIDDTRAPGRSQPIAWSVPQAIRTAARWLVGESNARSKYAT
jgi:hypothetical protein